MVKCNGICTIFILCTSVSHPAQSQLNVYIIIMYALRGKATKNNNKKKRNVLTHRGASCHCVDFFYAFLISLSTRVTRFPAFRVHSLPLARILSHSLSSSPLGSHISRRSWNWFWVQCVRSGCCRQIAYIFFSTTKADSALQSPHTICQILNYSFLVMIAFSSSAHVAQWLILNLITKKYCMDKCGANGYNLSHWLRQLHRSLGNSRSFSEW